jgi:hypothetical protein
MGELVELATVERWFGALAVLLPLVGLGIGAGLQFGARRPNSIAAGFAAGLLGPVNWLLWRVYNAIEGHYGLDSVRAMLLNLALFAVLGIAVGLGVRCSGFGVRKRPPNTDHRTPNT